MMKHLLILTLFLLSCTSSKNSSSKYCPDDLKVGNTKLQVLTHCGQPKDMMVISSGVMWTYSYKENDFYYLLFSPDTLKYVDHIK